MRVGVDMDGTLADLAAAYRSVERRLFGEPLEEPAFDQDETAEGAVAAAPVQRALAGPRAAERRRRQIWQHLIATPDFWTTLAPIEEGVVRRLYEVSVAKRWEVFFLTQRPRTAGDTVQRQTQRWLTEQGFEQPSVLTLTDSRGRAAAALQLDVLIDDLPRNCVDVVSDSSCHPFLVLSRPDAPTEASARRLNITVVPSMAAALDALVASPQPGVWQRVKAHLGM